MNRRQRRFVTQELPFGALVAALFLGGHAIGRYIGWW